MSRSPVSTISFVQKSANAQILTIQHDSCQASVCLYGGQVLSWQPAGQRDVFWLSEISSYVSPAAIRGGIPLCWPWFGGREGDKNHGFARNSQWQLEETNCFNDGVEVILTLAGRGEMPTWQHDYVLTQRLFFGHHFSQSLTIHNPSGTNWQFGAALHSYFRVSKPQDLIIPQLMAVPFDDKITQMTNCASQMPLTGQGPIDRIYHSNDTITLIDQGWQRMITVESEGCGQRVLWNPGADVASVMPDIHPSGEQEFVCFEVANTELQTLAAGQSKTIEQIITLA